MLVKSSICFGTRGYTFTLLYLWSLKVREIVPFSYLQVASGHKYNKIHEYLHTKVSMHVRDQHGKEKTILLLFIT